MEPLRLSDVDAAKYEPIVREMIRHENGLVHQRMTWLLAFHGLLFAALGFTWGKEGSAPLIYAFCVLGVAISLVSYFLVVLANRAMLRLQVWWNTNRPKAYAGPGVIGLPPEDPTRLGTLGVFIWGENWFSLLLLGAWVWILFTSHPR